MAYSRPFVLTLAGFDPSGGAGVLADIKTLEQHRCIGLSAVTALTRQTEDSFEATRWLSFNEIVFQAEMLFLRYPIAAVKIGIARDLSLVLQLVRWVRQLLPEVPIVWDTVLSASAGFQFIETPEQPLVAAVLGEVTLATPNLPEALLLSGADTLAGAGSRLAPYGNLLIKGGHATDIPGADYLYLSGQVTVLMPTAVVPYRKHGTGCILSAAIAGNLANGYPVVEACIMSKQYVEKILTSNHGLLAYHYV